MKKSKGITLIALIITIIVMLILAAVSISMAINGGLFGYAKKASEETEIARDTEQNLTFLQDNLTYEDLITKFSSNVTNVEAQVGMFIKYDVAYTDIYKDYEYTKTNGWRLLDFTDNGNGTLSNVKLISTGIPAKLYYDYDGTNQSTTDEDRWWVTETDTNAEPNLPTFKSLLGDEYDATNNPNGYIFYTGTSTYSGLQASAGLYYNLESFKFTNGTNYTTAWGSQANGKNRGWFARVVNGETVYDNITNTGKTVENSKTTYNGVTGENLFKAREDASVRVLTLPELNTAAGNNNDTETDLDSTSGYAGDTTGLYNLSALSTAMEGTPLALNIYNDGYYWLASPYPFDSFISNAFMCYITYEGGFAIHNRESYGIRPVICISSPITLVEHTETLEDESTWTYYTME